MIGALFKFLKKRPTSADTTIPLRELATLWRDPAESSAAVKKEKSPEPRPKNEPNEAESPSIDLTALIGVDKKSPANNNDSWFDQKALLATLQSRIACRTSAFVYQKIAYYTLETVAGALNQQRGSHNRKPLTPKEVIAFFKSEREHGLKNGKYILRFDKGLPLKVYLYTHPVTNNEVSRPPLPVDETGRHLKSLKPIKEPTP